MYRITFHFDNESYTCNTETSVEELIYSKPPNSAYVRLMTDKGNLVYFRYGHINYMVETKIDDDNDN